MSSSFVYDINPGRIVFGDHTLNQVGAELERLQCTRALVLSTPQQRDGAHQLATQLGELAVGVFDQATMHTPIAVTEQALAVYEQLQADAVVALGGGSTIGLGKAMAHRVKMPHIAIPTTYAGSEVTPILGQTEQGLKTTIRHAHILPQVVIYDPTLSLHLPLAMSITSGLNAMAHAVEALYAKDKNPISSLMAERGVLLMHRALQGLAQDSTDLAARRLALEGAWLCGTVLGTVGMSLHHKLCHTLGGSFNLPHAETHAILLPHSLAYNAAAAQAELQPLEAIYGKDLGAGLFGFAQQWGAPQALRDIGLKESDLDRATDLAVQNPYWNPRPIEWQAVRDMLERAWAGVVPF